MKIGVLFASAALLAGVTAAIAQADVIGQRKSVMKGVGAATRTGTQMARGDAPFDLAKAKEVFSVYEDAARKMPGLFPETSKTGGETSAAPRIWQDLPTFKAGFAKLEADAKRASGAAKDLPTFRVAFGDITKNCGGCHENFRISKN